MGAAIPRRSVCWHAELIVRGSGCQRAGTGDQDKSANIRRVPQSERWDAGKIREMRATPWSPDGSDNAFDIQVGIRVANIENNSLNWVSISSAGALHMTNCGFGGRRARDEMRHIIGSSKLDVIIGSEKDRNRRCKKKDNYHIEFLCELYEAQAAQGRTRAAVADLCMFGLAACDDGGRAPSSC